jgi:hypothetical protein
VVLREGLIIGFEQDFRAFRWADNTHVVQVQRLRRPREAAIGPIGLHSFGHFRPRFLAHGFLPRRPLGLDSLEYVPAS